MVGVVDCLQWCSKSLICGASGPHLLKFHGLSRVGDSISHERAEGMELDGRVVGMRFDLHGVEVDSF